MPKYIYHCPKCAANFEDVRSINAPTDVDCPKCAYKCDDTNYDWSKFKITVMNTKVQNAEYNPGLGQVVKNEYHKSEILKEKNIVEVGNDFGSGEKQQAHFEKRKKEEQDKIWTDPASFALE